MSYGARPLPKHGPQISATEEAWQVSDLSRDTWKIVAYQTPDMKWFFCLPLRQIQKHATTATLRGDGVNYAYVLVAKSAPGQVPN